MNKRERVYTALEGEPVDRVPLSMWRHFFKQETTPHGLVTATVAFYQKYDLDLIKLTPNGFYPILDWGAQLAFSKDDNYPHTLKKPVIKEPDDWRNLPGLNPTEGNYGQVLEAITLLKDELTIDDAPVLITIFSPLTIAHKLAGDTLFDHLFNHPTDVHIGLATIAETTSRFAAATLEAGADGIFFASQLSQADLLSEEMCQAFVVRYDLIALEQVKSQPAPLVLHLHGQNPYFQTVNQYPAHAVSWHNHETGPSLSKALTMTEKTLMAGLDRITLEQGTPDQVIAQARHAIRQTGGRRLILAPPCVLSPATPVKNLEALVQVHRPIR